MMKTQIILTILIWYIQPLNASLFIEAIYKTAAISRNYSLETLQKEQISNFTSIFTKWHIG